MSSRRRLTKVLYITLLSITGSLLLLLWISSGSKTLLLLALLAWLVLALSDGNCIRLGRLLGLLPRHVRIGAGKEVNKMGYRRRSYGRRGMVRRGRSRRRSVNRIGFRM